MKHHKNQPWGRGAYKRFGLYMAGATPSNPGSKIGWAILELRPKIGKGGADEMLSEDPFAAAIAKAQEAMAAGAKGVDLYRYRDAAAYAHSRDAAEGGTFAEHTRRIGMLAAALRELDIPVNILIVEE